MRENRTIRVPFVTRTATLRNDFLFLKNKLAGLILKLLPLLHR